jgi:hypothetical protein
MNAKKIFEYPYGSLSHFVIIDSPVDVNFAKTLFFINLVLKNEDL